METHPPRELVSLTALRERFAAIAHRTSLLEPAERAALRHSVCTAARELKDQLDTPECVVIRVRQLAREAGIPVGGDRLMEEVVRWCLAEYFGKAVGS